MSYEEHALENAINAMSKDQSMEEWAKNDINLDYIKATAKEIWSIAQYVIYTYTPWYYSELNSRYKCLPFEIQFPKDFED